MTIKLKLIISSIIVVAFAIFLGIVVLLASQKITNTVDSLQKSQLTVSEIFQQTIFLNNYLMHHQDKQAEQWQTQQKKLSALLLSQHFAVARDQQILTEIIQKNTDAANNFSRLIAAYKTNHTKALQDTLTTRLLDDSQSMVDKSFSLSGDIYVRQKIVRGNNVLILLVAIGILALLTTLYLFRVYKSITTPITKLVKGTKHVAQGDWDYIVEVNENDELGQLSKAFNAMTAKIKEYMQRQKELEQQKDDFIASASHELKSPLTALFMYIQVLKQQKPGSIERKGTLESVQQQLDELHLLTNDFLDAQKIENGKFQYSPVSFSLNHLVDEVVTNMQMTAKGHLIQTKFAKDSTSTVYADRQRIAQVLTNLISNAVKYSPKTKKVIVTVQNTDEEVSVHVQDFGIGIDSEDQKKIFNRFFRAGGEIEKTYPGMGLGLFISSQIIRHQGGKIWVESKKGEGSTFSFSLPIKKKPS